MGELYSDEKALLKSQGDTRIHKPIILRHVTFLLIKATSEIVLANQIMTRVRSLVARVPPHADSCSFHVSQNACHMINGQGKVHEGAQPT